MTQTLPPHLESFDPEAPDLELEAEGVQASETN